MIDYVMSLLGYKLDSIKPTVYIRGDQVSTNMYMEDSHPNDYSSRYIAGQSKGKMVGLEDVGWIGYSRK